MSFVKGFLISFVLSFLAFAVIILYGGSFAISLIAEDENVLQDELQDGSSDEGSQTLPTYTSHNTFSFALVITDGFGAPDEDLPETYDGEDNGKGDETVAPQTRETTGGEDQGTGEDSETPEDNKDNKDNKDNEGGEDSDGGNEPQTPQEPQKPEYITEFDELIAKYNKYPEYEIKFICVVSINATVSKTFITVIPGDLMVPIGDVEMDLTYANFLAERSELALDDFIPSTVIATTGIAPDFFGYVDIDDFVKLADELGGVSYENGKALTTVKKSDGGKITVPAGNIKLDSEMLSALLEYGNYSDGYTASQILIDVAAEMLDGICSKFKLNIITKVREMLEYVDTDFTTADMLRVSGVFFSYEGSEKNCEALLGAYENFENRRLFRPNYSGSVDKFKQYLN